MEKCKVALIHNIIAPYRIPIFEDLANHPIIDLKVFYCAKTHSNRNWEIDTRETYDYKVLAGICIHIGGINYHVNPSIVLELLRSKFDVVILAGCTDFTTQIGFIFSKLFKKPVIIWSEGILSARSKIGKLISPLTNCMISNADAIIVPGKLSRQYHISCGASPERVFIGPSIVDNDYYIDQCSSIKQKKESIKKELGIGNNKIIVFVGRLVVKKGVQILLEAFQLLRSSRDDISLLIVGDGPERDQFETWVSDHNIQGVIFTGWTDGDEKVKYYAIADVFVLPTMEDVWGLVVNEAMCCGLPIITSSSAGCSIDLVENDQNGYIVNPNNVDDIYQALLGVFEDPTKAELMGRRSLEKIQKDFSVEKTVDGFLSAIGHARGEIQENTNDSFSQKPMTSLRDYSHKK